MSADLPDDVISLLQPLMDQLAQPVKQLQGLTDELKHLTDSLGKTLGQTPQVLLDAAPQLANATVGLAPHLGPWTHGWSELKLSEVRTELLGLAGELSTVAQRAVDTVRTVTFQSDLADVAELSILGAEMLKTMPRGDGATMRRELVPNIRALAMTCERLGGPSALFARPLSFLEKVNDLLPDDAFDLLAGAFSPTELSELVARVSGHAGTPLSAASESQVDKANEVFNLTAGSCALDVVKSALPLKIAFKWRFAGTAKQGVGGGIAAAVSGALGLAVDENVAVSAGVSGINLGALVFGGIKTLLDALILLRQKDLITNLVVKR